MHAPKLMKMPKMLILVQFFVCVCCYAHITLSVPCLPYTPHPPIHHPATRGPSPCYSYTFTLSDLPLYLYYVFTVIPSHVYTVSYSMYTFLPPLCPSPLSPQQIISLYVYSLFYVYILFISCFMLCMHLYLGLFHVYFTASYTCIHSHPVWCIRMHSRIYFWYTHVYVYFVLLYDLHLHLFIHIHSLSLCPYIIFLSLLSLLTFLYSSSPFSYIC